MVYYALGDLTRRAQCLWNAYMRDSFMATERKERGRRGGRMEKTELAGLSVTSVLSLP